MRRMLSELTERKRERMEAIADKFRRKLHSTLASGFFNEPSQLE